MLIGQDDGAPFRMQFPQPLRIFPEALEIAVIQGMGSGQAF